MNTNDLPPPRIEFPCPNYPIKVIGDAGEGFAEMVIEVMQRHVADFDAWTLTRRDSSNGRFDACAMTGSSASSTASRRG